MSDILLTIGITVCITFMTILLDYVASKMITLSNLGRKVLKLEEENFDVNQFDEMKERLVNVANYYKSSRLERNIWGNELAVVALSLDFTAVGLWIAKPSIYPFFSHLNSEEIDRSILLCFLVLFIHVIIFLLSLVFKNLHLEKVSGVIPSIQTNLFTKEGIILNQYKVYNNSIGFVALTTSLLLYTLIV